MVTHEVKREDCIGHVQNGWALHCLVIGAGGKERLTDPIINGIQTAYGYDIRNNKGDES